MGYFPHPGPTAITTVVTSTGANGPTTVITETLKPTITTYKGRIYTGTITQRPSSTPPPATTIPYQSDFNYSTSVHRPRSQHNTILTMGNSQFLQAGRHASFVLPIFMDWIFLVGADLVFIHQEALCPDWPIRCLQSLSAQMEILHIPRNPCH